MKKCGTEKFKKKPIKSIFGKVNEGDEIKKKVWSIWKKACEGDGKNKQK